MRDYFAPGAPVHDTGVSNAMLEAVTHENFDRLVNGLEPVSAMHVAAGGVAARAIVSLWPFVVAFFRKRIN